MSRAKTGLCAVIATQLHDFGIATELVAQLPVPIDDWCAIARAAAAKLHRPMRIIQHEFADEDYVSAVIDDWPTIAAERHVLARQLSR